MRKGTVANRFVTDERPEVARWTPLRSVFSVGAAGNVVVGVWLLGRAAKVDGAWPIGWRVGLAVGLGVGALLFAIGGALGLAERREAISET